MKDHSLNDKRLILQTKMQIALESCRRKIGWHEAGWKRARPLYTCIHHRTKTHCSAPESSTHASPLTDSLLVHLANDKSHFYEVAQSLLITAFLSEHHSRSCLALFSSLRHRLPKQALSAELRRQRPLSEQTTASSPSYT